MRRILRVSAAAIFAAALLVPAAMAEGPVREPLEDQNLTWEAGQTCEFAVKVETLRNTATVKTFPDGHIVITGHLVQRLTNVTTGESRTLNVSGPLALWFNEDGSGRLIGRGPLIFFLFEGDVGGPGIVYTKGRVEGTFDENFLLTSFSRSGSITDLCAALAA
jgi:hypothetical protein